MVIRRWILIIGDFVEEFTSAQILEINKGLEQGLDMSIVMNPDFTALQIKTIRKGLELGVNITPFC